MAKILRPDQRPEDALRPVTLECKFYPYAEGSCLVSFGGTQVLCVATIEETAPPHLRGKQKGWITAEYNMLPRSSPDRIKRERDRVGGRTHEIQRLIGRALRSVVSMEGWGERSIIIDCDVIRADGGTRTASITGAFVALVQAFRELKVKRKLPESLAFPVKDYVSAVSVGVVNGQPVLDLNYIEDSSADTDMNLVMTAQKQIIEIQGTAEKEPFSKETFDVMLDLAGKGCESLCNMQRQILGPLDWK
jgi:ribonuclease PH